MKTNWKHRMDPGEGAERYDLNPNGQNVDPEAPWPSGDPGHLAPNEPMWPLFPDFEP